MMAQDGGKQISYKAVLKKEMEMFVYQTHMVELACSYSMSAQKERNERRREYGLEPHSDRWK